MSSLERLDAKERHLWMPPCTRRIVPAEAIIKATSLSDAPGRARSWCRIVPNDACSAVWTIRSVGSTRQPPSRRPERLDVIGCGRVTTDEGGRARG
jgi:hypothetical protein